MSNERSNSTNTIIFGRIRDLNPKAIKGKLQITYTLSKDQTGGMFGTDSAFPNIDPETDYFWVSVPAKEVKYFGIRSIRFMLPGIETTAIIRDELHHLPLFGLTLESSKEAKYIYVGDITIRSGTRRIASVLNLEVFDIREAHNRANIPAAKKYLKDKEFDVKKLVVKPFNLRKI